MRQENETGEDSGIQRHDSPFACNDRDRGLLPATAQKPPRRLRPSAGAHVVVRGAPVAEPGCESDHPCVLQANGIGNNVTPPNAIDDAIVRGK